MSVRECEQCCIACDQHRWHWFPWLHATGFGWLWEARCGGVLSQEETDCHGIDEGKGREEHWHWRCGAEDAAGQPQGCTGTGTQHPSLPAQAGRSLPLRQDGGCQGQTSKGGENAVSLS